MIASIDYAKRDASRDNPSGYSVRDALLQCSWDLVIVDEAHKASAALYGREVKATERYRLVEDLSRSPQVHHILFLTATPHQGKEEQFRLFLRLLDPDQFEAQDVEELRNFLAEDKCPFFMRRLKEELRDFEGRKLFLPRNAWTQDFELSGGELDLYREVTRYIQDFLGSTFSGRRRMAVDSRAVSSPAAPRVEPERDHGVAPAAPRETRRAARGSREAPRPPTARSVSEKLAHSMSMMRRTMTSRTTRSGTGRPPS